MSEGTPIEEVLEGVSDLPNAKFKFPNYARLDVKKVVVYGTRIIDTVDTKFHYRPTLCLFMNDVGDPPQTLCLHCNETFNDAETMAQMTVAWASMMFSDVSVKVGIFDYETDERIAHLDVREMQRMETAINELKEIHRTNTMRIH
jgi:hypothetical protein